MESVRPLMDDTEYERMAKLAAEFETGLGNRLQWYLKLKALWSSNYVSGWPQCLMIKREFSQDQALGELVAGLSPALQTAGAETDYPHWYKWKNLYFFAGAPDPVWIYTKCGYFKYHLNVWSKAGQREFKIPLTMHIFVRFCGLNYLTCLIMRKCDVTAILAYSQRCFDSSG